MVDKTIKDMRVRKSVGSSRIIDEMLRISGEVGYMLVT